MDNNSYIRAALWLFAAGIIAGVTAAFYYPQLMENILDSFAEQFGETPALDWGLAKNIFVQNATAVAVSWLGGILLGLAPIAALLLNGFILGYVFVFILAASTDKLATLGFLAAGLLPHGIIEIPVFIAACVLGLRMGYEWLKPDAQGRRLAVLGMELRQSLRYFMWIVAGLVAAAVIEVFVSGTLVGYFA